MKDFSMNSFLKMLRALVALIKSHLEAPTPWSHKEEVRQIQAYNALNRDEYGDIIYD